jgi:hypothetical protein
MQLDLIISVDTSCVHPGRSFRQTGMDSIVAGHASSGGGINGFGRRCVRTATGTSGILESEPYTLAFCARAIRALTHGAYHGHVAASQ